MKKILPLFILSVLLISCNKEEGEFYTLKGFTQGTTYRITYQHPRENDLQERIDTLLREFDLSLSAYEPVSVISRINRNETLETDSLFRTVFRESKRVWKESDGAFDITLGPVINAWGFGPEEKVEVDSALVDSLLQFVGMEKVRLEGLHMVKDIPEVEINVNAIAQGYSVDYIADFLESLGCVNYMVEIGGEIKARGKNPKGVSWRIGIDRPAYGNMIPGMQMQAIVNMKDRSLATSGNYRKFYEKDGVRITHSIDPHTGYPRPSNLLSVTILCDECMAADAYATTCMVLGLEKARDFIEARPDVDAYFIYGDEEGAYQVWCSDNLKKYIEEP